MQESVAEDPITSQKDETAVYLPLASNQLVEPPPPKRSRGSKNIMTPHLVATIDTGGLTVRVRKGAAVIAASAMAVDADVQKLNVNKSTLHRARSTIRRENARKVRNRFISQIRKKK